MGTIEAWTISFRGYLSRTEKRDVDILEDIYKHPLSKVYREAFEQGIAFSALMTEFSNETLTSNTVKSDIK